MPPRWLLKFSSRLHVFFFRLTGGRMGNTVNGLPVLLLTTTGRRSGENHTTPVVFLRHGAEMIIAPGVVEKPDWFRNLKRHPQAQVQIGASVLRVLATQVGHEERSRLWEKVPDYWNDYQRRARTELPLILLKDNP
jgi:deazaflavin-dependent oxidoreductase (nitroreductase family)